MSTPGGSTALGWYPDPSGRHELRFWDGGVWTTQVADAGVLRVDDAARPPAPSPYGAAPAQALTTQRGAGAPPTAPPPPRPGLPAWSPGSVWTGLPAPGAFIPSGAPAPLASRGLRFGAYLLEGVLALVTLGIGWIVWACVTFSRGQTPAKSITGQRVVKLQTGVAASWGEMFLRNIVVQFGIGLLSVFLFGIPTIVAACMIFSGTLNQTGWDRIMGTVVVVDRDGVTVPPGR